MNAYLRLAIIGGCFLVTAVRADQDPKAREVIDRAIKESGGATHLARFNAHTFQSKGTYHGMGQPLPYESKGAIQWPDRFKMEIVGVFTIVVNGDKGWMHANGSTMEMDETMFKQHRTNNYAAWVTTLLPLRESAFHLIPLDVKDIAGEAAAGVRVTRTDRPDVELYFSKQSGRLIQSAFQGHSDDGSKELRYETKYLKYHDYGGAWIPSQIEMTRDGMPFVEEEVTELVPAEKLGEAVFSRP